MSELRWNIWDTGRNLEEGLFAEDVIRNIVQKYDGDEFINSYNNYVQDVNKTSTKSIFSIRRKSRKLILSLLFFYFN
ncbi:hypothetical protein [Clostridium kluyveri]|uniref:Uncharacterized protein n=1 Tax=Clostridium kluyveri TaxID=1534 RepID=A0A1L5F678_CLOKL|nr:hypothetical protein [Clostridium kluyveri]APM38516.1 hypothetical protein BS101_07070 [Clostridium kluyveri]